MTSPEVGVEAAVAAGVTAGRARVVVVAAAAAAAAGDRQVGGTPAPRSATQATREDPRTKIHHPPPSLCPASATAGGAAGCGD